MADCATNVIISFHESSSYCTLSGARVFVADAVPAAFTFEEIPTVFTELLEFACEGGSPIESADFIVAVSKLISNNRRAFHLGVLT